MAYTEGFTPRPKMSFGLALPTGAESIAEYIDIDLAKGADFDTNSTSWPTERSELVTKLTDALPLGMDVITIVERDPSAGSLQEQVSSTTWELSGPGIHPDELESAAQRLLSADELIVERERKGRRHHDDVRPLIRDLRPDSTGTAMVAELETVGRALRPAELAGAMFPGIDTLNVRVLRTAQCATVDGEQRELIAADCDGHRRGSTRGQCT